MFPNRGPRRSWQPVAAVACRRQHQRWPWRPTLEAERMSQPPEPPQPPDLPRSSEPRACPNCGAPVAASARACPNCGADLHRDRSRVWLAVVGLIAVAALGVGIAALASRNESGSHSPGSTAGATEPTSKTTTVKIEGPTRTVTRPTQTVTVPETRTVTVPETRTVTAPGTTGGETTSGTTGE